MLHSRFKTLTPRARDWLVGFGAAAALYSLAIGTSYLASLLP